MAKFTISALDTEGTVRSTHSVPVDDFNEAGLTLACTLAIATMTAIVAGRSAFTLDYVKTLQTEWDSHDGTDSFEIRKTRDSEDGEITDLFEYSV